MEEVNGKVAFVTGGASGIGLGMTRAFLKAGMQVAIGDLQSGGNLTLASDPMDSPTATDCGTMRAPFF